MVRSADYPTWSFLFFNSIFIFEYAFKNLYSALSPFKEYAENLKKSKPNILTNFL